jgi:hypothetical protein
MKKFSINSSAVLAIVLALSSAFTTSKSFAPDTWERFGVTPNQLGGDIYGYRTLDDFHATVGSPGFTDIDIEISSYNQAHQLKAQVSCASNVEHICAAIVKYNTTPDNERETLDFNFGDYSLSL